MHATVMRPQPHSNLRTRDIYVEGRFQREIWRWRLKALVATASRRCARLPGQDHPRTKAWVRGCAADNEGAGAPPGASERRVVGTGTVAAIRELQ